jgi:Flp pilus assembly protein TadD
MNEPQAPDWRTWIQQGTEVFRKGRSAEAVSWFEKACESSPGTAVPHLYLAIALYQRYIPGALSEEHAELRRRTEIELLRAWDLDPHGWIAAALLGQLAVAERRFTDAREWYGKALALQSNDAGIWCMLGFIASQQGLRNEAIADFEKSVSLDPMQTDAMEYLSHMIGGEWLERLSDARSESAQAFLAGAKSVASDSRDPDWLLKTWTRGAALSPLPPLPPQPPPPPPPGVDTRRGSGSSATISFDRMPTSNEPPPIRVASPVQARKLIRNVEPEAPADWPEEPPMRFVVVIGNDGRIGREILISGNPWLAQTAVAALREWVYEPTLVEEKPIAVVTEVRIEFRRPRVVTQF